MAKNEKETTKNKSHYFKDMKAELKKVVWPSRKQTANNTMAVIVFAIAVALIVFVLDLCFDAINKYGVKNVQQKITSSYSKPEEKNEAESNSETEGEGEAEGEEENKESETDANQENTTSVEVTTETEAENNTESE